MKQHAFSPDVRTRIFMVILAVAVLFAVTAWRRNNVAPKAARAKSQVLAPKQKGIVVDTGVTYPGQPVELTELNVGGKPAALSRAVQGDTDWLNGLQWNVKNVSQKNILSIDLFLIFPDIEVRGGRRFVHPMHYGVDLKLSVNSSASEPLKPNEAVNFILSESDFAALKPLLESKIPLAELRHLRIKLELIVFDDDTAWASGQEMRRDSKTPGRWVPVQ